MNTEKQTVRFLEVAKGLQEGLVYRHPSFGKDEYLVLNAFDEIKRFDGFRDFTDPQLSPNQVLSDEWARCEKQVWYLLGMEHQDTRDSYYDLIIEEKDHYLPWDAFPMAKDELSEYQRFISFKIAKNALLSEEEKAVFQKALEGNEEEMGK